MIIPLKNETETTEVGAKVASCLKGGEVIYLKGELGTGKTTLVRGALNKLGFVGNVKSPTYTIVEPYSIDNHDVYHFDLYRLNGPEELESLGIRDYCDGQSICFFEWPEKGENLTPNADINLLLTYTKEGRNVELTAVTEIGKSILATAF
jgi:tRNA threonylcarbamoyladenosine biosynthesis protein TsaE